MAFQHLYTLRLVSDELYLFFFSHWLHLTLSTPAHLTDTFNVSQYTHKRSKASLQQVRGIIYFPVLKFFRHGREKIRRCLTSAHTSFQPPPPCLSLKLTAHLRAAPYRSMNSSNSVGGRGLLLLFTPKWLASWPRSLHTCVNCGTCGESIVQYTGFLFPFWLLYCHCCQDVFSELNVVTLCFWKVGVFCVKMLLSFCLSYTVGMCLGFHKK